MSNLPMRVSLTTSAGRHAAQTIASQCSRRACSAGSIGRKWSSRNSMVAMTMSPLAMSARAALAAPPASSPHSAAACTAERRPGQLARAARGRARSAALARWLSIVTMTTRIGVSARAAASAAEVGFCVVQGLDGDQWPRRVRRRSARCCGAPCRARRTGSSSVPARRRRPRPDAVGRRASRLRRTASAGAAAAAGVGSARSPPARGRRGRAGRRGARARRRRGTRSRSRNMSSRCSSRPIISGCTQVSKITLAPSKPICGE